MMIIQIIWQEDKGEFNRKLKTMLYLVQDLFNGISNFVGYLMLKPFL